MFTVSYVGPYSSQFYWLATFYFYSDAQDWMIEEKAKQVRGTPIEYHITKWETDIG